MLFREFIQKSKVTILMFHDISSETAEKTFVYLKKKYNIIDLNEFIEVSERKDGSKLPKKSIIITFDDGHIGNYEMLSVLKKYSIPVTIFLCSSIINTNRHYWFKYKNLPMEDYKLKLKSNEERLNILSEAGFEQDKEYNETQALQKEHIDEMKEFVNMQCHTMFHPILPKCNDIEAENEIINSKIMLEKEYNFKINAIAYPNGDYSERDVKLVQKAGYKCAITVDYGFNTVESDFFRLKRISVNDTKDLNELIVKSSGVWLFLKTLIKPMTKSTYLLF